VPVLTAAKLMYAGAAVSTVTLVIALALIPAIKAALRKAHPSLTAAQVSHVNTLIALAIVFGLVVIALWLWMARANGQGRNWARVLCTVLFGLATLELIRVRRDAASRSMKQVSSAGTEIVWVLRMDIARAAARSWSTCDATASGVAADRYRSARNCPTRPGAGAEEVANRDRAADPGWSRRGAGRASARAY